MKILVAKKLVLNGTIWRAEQVSSLNVFVFKKLLMTREIDIDLLFLYLLLKIINPLIKHLLSMYLK